MLERRCFFFLTCGPVGAWGSSRVGSISIWPVHQLLLVSSDIVRGHTILDSHELVQHALIGQLSAHWRHPIDGPVDDDETVDMRGLLDLCVLGCARLMMPLKLVGESLPSANS